MEEIEEINEEQEDEVSVLSTNTKRRTGRQQICARLRRLVSTIARCFADCREKKKRREDIEIASSPQNGVNIRMLRDQKGSSDGLSGGSVEEDVPLFDTLEVSLESSEASGTPTGESPVEVGTRGLRAKRSLFVPRISSSGGQEAEERLLSRAIGRPPTSSLRPRFLTLHRRKRRRPPTRALMKEGAVLDDLYNGPTQCVLKSAALWDFNAFVLDSVSGGRPVTVLCVFFLHQYNLLTQFALDAVTVWKCFSLIEEGYHSSNPYHNAIHAADVTQAMHCYLQETAIDKYLTPFEKLGAIIASVCHDLDHPGVNQPFLIATDNHLAALYNNASVLENHHWRCAMGCLWESGFLDKWSQDQVEELQEMVRSLILATDITRQGEFLNRFKKYQDTDTFDMTSAECRHFSLQIALKCADICNPCRSWETSRQWSQKICDEFYRQGDYERQLHLPVTPMCDRFTNSVANIQTGFIKFVVAPLFEAWHRWLETDLSGVMLDNLHQNLSRWEDILWEERGDPLPEPEPGAEPVKVDTEAAQPSDSSSGSNGGRSNRGSVWECPLVGRRHSLPLTIPSLLPRTVIRRESLTREEGVPPLVFETLQIGESVVDSVVTMGTEGEEPFFHPPSIAAMGEVGKPRRVHHSRAQRRQSLPPLWDNVSLLSRSPLQPMPPTPLQEELPPIDFEEEEKKPLLKKGADTPESGEQNGGDGGKDTGEGSSSYKHALDEPRYSVEQRGSVEPLEEGDKENVAPPRDRGERSTPNGILKTRLWRSLNQEEEAENFMGRGSKTLFKHLPQNDLMRRRGSAPLLKLEEIRSSLKGSEKPFLDLPKRRGSVPINQMTLQLGSDALRLLSEERVTEWQPPFLPKENLLAGLERNPFNPLPLGGGSNRLVQRRGSVPWEGSKMEHQVVLSNHGGGRGYEKTLVVSDGGGGLPMGFLPSDTHSGESVGGGGLTPHLDARRGSTGFELLSGLWR